MKIFTNRIFISLILPIIFSGLFAVTDVRAQTGGTCQVTLAEFRTSRPLGPLFYSDSNTPFVYIDIETQNCIGQTIEVSITEDDAGVDDDVNGTLGLLQDCDNSNNSCMDNRIVNVLQNNFTLSLRAGEDECQNAGSPDCEYHLETWDAVTSGQEWNASVLGYGCDGTCDINWQYLGPLSAYPNATHAGDPDDAEDPGGDVDPGPVDPGGDVDPSDTNTGPTVIDLHLINPLAGTIDTLPQLLQKIVYIIIKIAIPLVAIAIVYAGLLFVTARGSEEQIKKAKNALAFAVIGGLILLASWLVADAIRDALTTLDT